MFYLFTSVKNLAEIQGCDGQISTWHKFIYITLNRNCASSHCIHPNNSPDPIPWNCITAMTLGANPTPTPSQDATGWTPALCPCSMNWCEMWWQRTGRSSAGLGQNGQAQVKRMLFFFLTYSHDCTDFYLLLFPHTYFGTVNTSLQYVYSWIRFGEQNRGFRHRLSDLKNIRAFGNLPNVPYSHVP